MFFAPIEQVVIVPEVLQKLVPEIPDKTTSQKIMALGVVFKKKIVASCLPIVTNGTCFVCWQPGNYCDDDSYDGGDSGDSGGVKNGNWFEKYKLEIKEKQDKTKNVFGLVLECMKLGWPIDMFYKHFGPGHDLYSEYGLETEATSVMDYILVFYHNYIKQRQEKLRQ